MTTQKRLLIPLLGVALLFGGLWIRSVLAEQTKTDPVAVNTFVNYRFFATSTTQSFFATTTSATSTNLTAWFDSSGIRDNGSLVIKGAKKVTMYFQRGASDSNYQTGNVGTTTFSVQVSPDGSTWYDFNKLLPAFATTTLVSSNVSYTRFVTIPSLLAENPQLVATSTGIFSLDLTNTAWYAIRCIVIETTDGEHSCRASVSWEN